RACLPATKHGKLLITSQYQSFPTFLGAEVIPVDWLPPDTAVKFVEMFAKLEASGEEERESLVEVAKMLGHLPIAIEQAAAYVRTTGLSYKEYKSLLKKEGLSVLPPEFDRATAYQHSAQTVCRLALDEVKKRCPEARLLLEFVAFLSAEADCLLPLAMLALAP